MKQEIKLALKKSIIGSLPILREIGPNYVEQFFCWSKEGEGRWRGIYRPRISFTRVLLAAENKLQQAASKFADLFYPAYPEYGPGKMVGISGFMGMQLGQDRATILKSALSYLWKTHGSFDGQEAHVDQLVNDFEKFVEQSTVRIRFQVPLVNFRTTSSTLSLPEGLMIRRLSEDEVSNLQGGNVPSRFDSSGPINEFALEGEWEVAKASWSEAPSNNTAQERVNNLLYKVLLSLRTFKEGFIGYYWVHFNFVGFSPLVSLGSYGSLDGHVRPGIYSLTSEDEDAFICHAKNIFVLSETAMVSACARMSDAEARHRPQDQIMDAVIGMEALLLAGLGKDDRRSELKYRFSLNFSSLCVSGPDRWQAYKLAKDLYDHRSTIAHGSELTGHDLRVGEKRCDLNELAKIAKGELRKLIKRFLPETTNAPYKDPRFWEHAYFGISSPK